LIFSLLIRQQGFVLNIGYTGGNSKIWQTFYGLVWPFSIRQKIRHFRRDKFEELSKIFFLRGSSATFGSRKNVKYTPFLLREQRHEIWYNSQNEVALP